MLRDHRLLADRARQLLKRNVIPTEDAWGGWLGRYQDEVRKSALELARQAERGEQTKIQQGKEKGIGHVAAEGTASNIGPLAEMATV